MAIYAIQRLISIRLILRRKTTIPSPGFSRWRYINILASNGTGIVIIIEYKRIQKSFQPKSIMLSPMDLSSSLSSASGSLS